VVDDVDMVRRWLDAAQLDDPTVVTDNQLGVLP
jgi:hypothetical protein